MDLKKLIYQYMGKDVGTKNRSSREDWLENLLTKVPQGQKILDAGAGESRYKKYCSHLDYVSQDIAEYEGEEINEGIHTSKRDYTALSIQSDICDIPVESNTFDVIMCIEVLEHVEDPLPALAELNRILKKGGKLILTAPFNSLTHYAPYHFSTGFTQYYYKKHLKNLNFEISEITPNGNYFEYLGQEIRRLDEVSGKYSKKGLNYFEKLIILIQLRILKKYSILDTGSEELLCFGYQVVALKK